MKRLWQCTKANKFYLAQIFTFCIAKIFVAIVQLPRYTKTQNYLPLLVVSALFYMSSFLIKLYNIKSLKLFEYLLINLKLFLVWIVQILVLIFSISLSHALQWELSEIILLAASLFIQNAIFVSLCYEKYISKLEFIVYELILCINIVSLGIKTVLFLQFQKDSPFKDLILLNLTTQIALSVLLIDSIERSYKAFLHKVRNQLQNQMQQQLTNNS